MIVEMGGSCLWKMTRDMNKIPGEWLLRMRYNPFYDLLESRVLEWLRDATQLPETE